MSRTATAPIAIFGDLEADLWGILVGGDEPRVAVGGFADAGIVMRPAELDLGDGANWTLNGDACALHVKRTGASAATPEGTGSLAPCDVTGAVTIAGVEREFDLGGFHDPAVTLDELASLRILGSWFPDGHQIGLTAARPKGAKDHGGDRIETVARGEEHTLILESRLSTAYDGTGAPRRVGVELWLGDDEDGDEWPRRVTGATTGAEVRASALGASLSAHAIRCVSRFEPGAGVYVLLTASG